MNAPSLFFLSFRLDVGNAQLWQEEQAVPLRRKTLAVLQYLVEHAGQLVTKAQLFDALWSGVSVEEGALTICIAELRKALDDDARKPRVIETVHGQGYRFIAPLSTAPPVPSSNTLDATLQPQPSVLVGREAELDQLHVWLAKALNGERQIVFVTGEPGIGKTTVVDAFLSGISKQGGGNKTPTSPRFPTSDPWISWGQCIEQHGAGEAFLPLLEAVGRLCRDTQGGEMIALLRRHAPMWLVQLPAFLAAEELEMLQRQVLGASRERMLREMAEALERLTTAQPLILVLEDLHWSDMSTLDFLAFLARRREPARLLVIGTYRPMEMLHDGHPLKSVTQELYSHQLAAELSLTMLREADIEAYLGKRFGVRARRAASSHTLVHTLHQRTGGNPLFLVSLIDDLVVCGALTHTEEGWTVQDQIDPDGIPATIRHLVARQQERLSLEEQRLLEAASVARLEFSAASVAAALGREITGVEQQCERLAERQQFLRRVGVAEWPDGTLAARYGFLHALYQQLWHERVSPMQLQYYHLRIGERYEAAYGTRAREIAPELAVHFEQGRNYGKAVQYFQQAGENAIRRSAHKEAINLLTKGLELLDTLPDTRTRVQQELMLHVTLGAPLEITRGYSSPEVRDVYTRTRELCHQVGETHQLFRILYGLRTFHHVRGEFRTARELGEQLLGLAQREQDPALLLEAYRVLGITLFHLGEFGAAQAHLEQVLTLYDAQRHHSHVFLYSMEPGVFGFSNAAWVLWYLGYPDQALQKSQTARTLAQEQSHPYSLAAASVFAAMSHQLRRESALTQEWAEAVIILAREQGFPQWLGLGFVLQGWALAEEGQVEEGIAQIRQGLATNQAAGTGMFHSYFLALLAEAYGKTGQAKDGLVALADALTVVDKSGERFCEAEIYRLKGQLILIQSSVQRLASNVQKEAEACFLKAIEIARPQSAKSLELRAAMSLARLWQRQDKQAEAHKMLAEIYGWFTEGFDTQDLREANALLEELT